MNTVTIHGDGNMAVITTIGISIMKLRKAEGLTQMGLAEKMGVSFQAVSNWERGISCPDIEKLTELTKIFHVSLDAIIGNKKTMAAIDAVTQEHASATVEDVQEAAPFLTQEQTDRAATKCCIPLEELVEVAPFVSQKFIDDYVEKTVQETGCLKDIRKLAPFVSTNLLDRFAEEKFKQTGELDSIKAILPFISNTKLKELTRTAYNQGGIPAVKHAAPFVETVVMDELARDALKKHGLGGLSPVLPFISSYILEDFLKSGGSSFGAE